MPVDAVELNSRGRPLAGEHFGGRAGHVHAVVGFGPFQFEVAAGQVREHLAAVRPVSTPATHTAHAPVPHASVMPLPRSHVRIVTSLRRMHLHEVRR